MRYILNNEGYVETISFTNPIVCNGSCTEYTGAIPEGYSSLLEWSENAVIQAYKIVDGNLTHDPNKEAELIDEWNSCSSINFMTIGLKLNKQFTISTAWSYTKLVCDDLKEKLGDKLSFENGVIKIGKGIKYIKVSANGMTKGITSSQIINITLNGNYIFNGYYTAPNTGSFGIIALTPCLVKVSEGDEIGLSYGAGATGSLTIAGGSSTYLTVEVLN